MPLSLGLLGPSVSRSSRTPRVETFDDPDGFSDEPSQGSASHPRARAPFTSSPLLASNAHVRTEDVSNHPGYLYPSFGAGPSERPSPSSTAMNTPIPSRSNSPLPPFYSSGPSSASTSESESEPGSPLLAGPHVHHWPRDGRPRWWNLRQAPRQRLRRERGWSLRGTKRFFRRVFRHPFFPKQPITILLALLFFTVLALSITVLLIHVLNPDKEPLPWRAYCTVPSTSTNPPPLNAPPTFMNVSIVASAPPMPHFPPKNFDSLPPAGVFIGVFSVDSSYDRRMMIRTTWASHQRSRNGAGKGDNGDGTSRTVVRFIMGQPRKAWERRVRLEMEKYHDLVILPVSENMNSGKTHTFFSWAAEMAWVPPHYFRTTTPPPSLSYSNITNASPPPAEHDPPLSRHDWASGDPMDWVRPDFVVKADDDSFVMLAELEARLRVELHEPPAMRPPHFADQGSVYTPPPVTPLDSPDVQASPTEGPHSSIPIETVLPQAPQSAVASPGNDPLIYWGYLVKQRFMAGEMYALSWSLVDWVAKDPAVKGLTRGAEDKQTAKWMRLHPRASEIRWKAERCWIYDHPRSGTVYSHGFLFPSEVARVRRAVMAYFDKSSVDTAGGIASASTSSQTDANPSVPTAWSYSTVSKFGVRYSTPLPDLSTLESVEALVEGSGMSQLHEGSILTARDAWRVREGRKTRYDDQRIGGTIVVHFIKKHMWFLETAVAFLEGVEETELDLQRKLRQGSGNPIPPPASHRPRPLGSSAMGSPHSRTTGGHGLP
ncbi:hypothetical protein BV25DRAFT_1911232 [Artomyces pyxidatus]|uniref:Uncharacterized protein n=1 Tax=Artomyces pyxidatus TaxID=48021 RepID=A0ACB8TIL6_9AGAM|nr:hypothetical protein BV25DRAFT_1911232 [Artomyces pyxidatus]